MLLRGEVHSLRGVGKLVRARDGLHDDVFFFDAVAFERLDCAVEQGGDDGGVPAGVDDAYSEAGAFAICQFEGVRSLMWI